MIQDIMGALFSCCGGRRKKQTIDEDEEARLLFDDPNGMHYGSFGEQQMSGPEDPLEVQREIEALQRVVARTSDNMVDVFDIGPQEPPTQQTSAAYTLPAQDARTARYQTLLSKLAANNQVASHQLVDWAVEDEAADIQGPAPQIHAESGEPLVGNFAEAARAA